jgi:hypothetical protein
MKQDHLIVSDPDRPPVVATRRDDGGVWISNAHGNVISLSAHEAERLSSFISGRAHIERYPVTTPAKARFEPAP